MKKLLATFALCSGALIAADTLPTFPERKIELPPLSFTENTKQVRPPSIWSEAGAGFRCQAPPPVLEPRFVSKMPVIVPEADIDPKILKAPDSSVDFKLIVKSPDIDPVK